MDKAKEVLISHVFDVILEDISNEKGQNLILKQRLQKYTGKRING